MSLITSFFPSFHVLLAKTEKKSLEFMNLVKGWMEGRWGGGSETFSPLEIEYYFRSASDKRVVRGVY